MSKRRLLIVDDELEICELIADVALGQGFDAKMVTDPKQVENVLQDFQPHALILDLTMPGADGVELLRELGHLVRNMPVVLMSGQDSHTLEFFKNKAKGYGTNVVAVKEKPIQIEKLREIMGKLA
jgi:DNA-binding response OmpR family regulator